MKILIVLLFTGFFWSPDHNGYIPPPYDTTIQKSPSAKHSIPADSVHLVKSIHADTISERATNAPLSTDKGEGASIKPGIRDTVYIKPAPGNSRLTGSSKIIIWSLILISVAGFLFLYFKLKKMSYDLSLKDQMLESHTREVEELRKFLLSNNLLTPTETHLNEIFKSIEGLITKYLAEDKSNQEKNKEIEALRTSLQQVKQESEEAKKSSLPAASSIQLLSQFVPYSNREPGISIKSEIMLTAGPRKEISGNDTELGEDVAGIVSFSEETFFWLLDGTSDSAAITGKDQKNSYEVSHIFSSRLLAQNLGHYIQKNIQRCFREQIPLEDLLNDGCNYLKSEWEKRINSELQEKKESILQQIGRGHKILCSTTVLMGRLLNNGHLYALRSGDSKIFLFKQVNEQIEFDKQFRLSAEPKYDYDRIFFQLDYDESTAAFVINKNAPRWLTETSADVQSVFAFSDGIGRITEAQLASRNPGIVEVIRQNIGRIPQKTFDDKSLIILERVSSNP